MRCAVMALIWAVSLAAADPAALEALHQQSTSAFERGQYDEAGTGAARLLEQATAEQNRQYVGLAHLTLGEIALVQSDWTAALPHYQALVPIALAENEPVVAAYAHLGVGLSAGELRRWTEAQAALAEGAKLYQEAGDANYTGICRMRAADFLTREGRFPEARDMALAALESLKETDNIPAAIQAMFIYGVAQSTLGVDGEARDAYQAGLDLAAEHELTELMATGHNNLGMLALSLADYPAAEEHLAHAVELQRKIGNLALLPIQLGNLASALHARGRPEEAVATGREAIELAQQAGDSGNVAVLLNGLGLILTEQGELDEAMRLLQEAEALQLARRDALGLATVRNNIANVLVGRGDLRGALALHLVSAEVLDQAGLKEMLATVYNNIGRLYDIQSDLEQAMIYFAKSIDLGAELNRPVLMAKALNNTALALHNAIRPALPLDELEDPETIANARGILTQAYDYYTQAADLFEMIGDERYLATVLNNMGQAASELGQRDQAIEHLRRSLAIHERLGQRLGIAQTSANLGLELYRQGDQAAAVAAFERGLKEAERIGELEIQAMTWFNLALLDGHAGRMAEAATKLYRAVDLVEQRREMIGGGQEQQRLFMTNNLRYYLNLIDVLMEIDRPTEAYAVAERVRGRALLDMMAGGQVDIRRRIPAAQLERLKELERRLAEKNKELLQLGNAAAAEEAALAAAKEGQVVARDEVRAEEARLAGLYPAVAAGAGSQPLNYEQVAARVPADTALFQYLAWETGGLLFVITSHDGPQLKTYPIGQDDVPLAEMVTRFREACANPRRRYTARGNELYELLVGPAIAELPEGIKRLVIIPDDHLYDCPFQALWTERSEEFLADQYEIDYAISGSLMAATLDLGEQRRAAPSAGNLLLVANPTFGAEAARTANRELQPPSVRGFELVPLPGTQAEAEAIAALMPRAKLLTGEAAQETAVKQSLADYRYLHFATHGLLDPESPLYSSIALAHAEDSSQDGFIEARELIGFDLTAELVTLSACQTGRGKAECGEGLIGLPWAFFVAGVPTQVVSLWSVDDFMTKELMTRFYRRLAAGEPTAAALRAAALELRETEIEGPGGTPLTPSHPFYWAPFVVVGDWR